jgi:hypothetical protein
MFDGTSCSAPATAAMITLANDARLNAHKAPLGFLNAMLYEAASKAPHVFNDVIVGDISCRRSGSVCCEAGYPAAVGWVSSVLGCDNILSHWNSYCIFVYVTTDSD